MSIKLKGSSDGSVSLQAPADTSPTGTDKTFTLPAQDGDAGQILKTNGSGALSFTDNLSSGRNLIINGAMQVSQRGDSTGVTTTGYYGPDRYRFIGGGSEAYSISKSTTAPEGFSNSWKLDCTTAGSMGTSGLAILQQRIEAQNLQHLKYGTSSAVNLTASFWIRSNKTGVVTVEFYQPDDVRQIAKTITINAANTWEYKTVTIPGDTTGVIDNNNDRGLELLFWLGAGTNYTSGTHNTSAWATANNTSNRVSSSNIDISDSTANELYLTGVQLEVGDTATPFEHRSFHDEQLRCMRYFQKFGETLSSSAGSDDGFVTLANYTATAAYGGQKFIVPMRARPSLSSTGCAYFSNNSNDSSITLALIGASTTYGELRVTGITMSAGHAGWLRIQGGGAFIQFDAEL